MCSHVPFEKGTNTIPYSSLFFSLFLWYRFYPRLSGNTAQMFWAIRINAGSQDISVMHFSLVAQYGTHISFLTQKKK